MTINLTLDHTLKIPATARAEIKALIVGSVNFSAWHKDYGPTNKATRDFTKGDWIDAALALGLSTEVLEIVARHGGDNSGEATDDMSTNNPAMIAPAAALHSLDDVLAPVRPFIASTLLDALSDKIKPLLDAANKPAEKIVEKIVERVEIPVPVSAGPVAPGETAPAPFAKPVDKSTLGKIFRVSGRWAKTPLTIWDASDAPAVDPFYVVDPHLIARLVTAIERGRYVWMTGPAGTGKTAAPRAIAAATGRPFVRIAFQRSIEILDLIGMKELDGKGGMVWTDAVLTQAIRRPGTIILLDELTFAPPGVLAILQTLLDENKITLPTGEVVRCAPGVVFFVADNTNGNGDATGVYAGTQVANGALVDRMARMVEVNYLSKELESNALVNHTGAPKAAALRLVEFFQDVRKSQAQEGGAFRPISLRRAIAFVEAVQDGFNPDEAAEMVLLTRLPDADRETMRQTFRAQFDASAFVAEMTGQPVPVAQSQSPEQVAARDAFETVDSVF